jgi:hypothetical protein
LRAIYGWKAARGSKIKEICKAVGKDGMLIANPQMPDSILAT